MTALRALGAGCPGAPFSKSLTADRVQRRHGETKRTCDDRCSRERRYCNRAPSSLACIGSWAPGCFCCLSSAIILGTGIYALTGQVAKVGGVVWLPFVVAFVVALVTAFSYLELVTKYPKAAGAALYTHKAFGIHFVTFIVAFAVMCSGITSASTASRAFAANMSNAMGLNLSGVGITSPASFSWPSLPRSISAASAKV